MTQEQKMHAEQLAQRVYDLIDPWDLVDETPEDIARDIQDKPLDVIEYLLNIVEDYRA